MVLNILWQCAYQEECEFPAIPTTFIYSFGLHRVLSQFRNMYRIVLVLTYEKNASLLSIANSRCGHHPDTVPARLGARSTVT